VARLDEARALRRAGFGQPVLVLGYTPAAQAESAVRAECDLTVFDLKTVAALERAARSAGRKPTVHLKVDTGMGRLGAHIGDAAGLAQTISQSEWLVLGGVFTHLGRADAQDKSDALGQLARFDRALTSIRKRGVNPGTVHAANSAATVSIPAARYDMVRCGVAVYGIDPSPAMRLPDGFVPALSMYARIAQVRDLPAGSYVGYGTAGRLDRDARVAVVAAGYGDGVRRGPDNWGPVLVRGQTAPIIGNVCMDMLMIDVSHVPEARQGDEVVLLGTQLGRDLSTRDAGARVGTITYEIVTELLSRVPRV
jgi:alanine racemase